MSVDGADTGEGVASQHQRVDLHWLALRLYQGLGSAENEVVRRHGLSLWGYEVLTAIADTPHRSQLALARTLGIDKSKMVLVLDELQTAGFITRAPDPADRRVRIIQATTTGLAARSAAAAELQKTEDLLLADLSDDDRETLLTVLHHVVNGPLLGLRNSPPKAGCD